MLVVVVLWAAAPAFACLAPEQSHACCRQMAMANCDMSSMGATPACCQVQAPDTNGAPATSAASQGPIEVAHPVVRVMVAADVRLGGRLPLIAETPPPLALAGSSILRI